MYKCCFKRLFDITLSFFAIVLLSPIIGILSLLVKRSIGTPIFFKQDRTGKGQKVFSILKFRTMTDEKDEQGNLLPDHDRVTRIGKILRSTSLDELPELLNILKGDMSIIGPRPLPTKYEGYYKEDELDRFMVRGGLIPPDSLDSNPIISWDRQFQYEAEYARKCSFFLDVKILISAIGIIMKRSQSSYGSFERMPLNIERSKMGNRSND